MASSSSSTIVLSTLFSSFPHQTLNKTKNPFSSLTLHTKSLTLNCSTFLKPPKHPPHQFHTRISQNQIRLSRRFRAYTTIGDADKDEQTVVGEDSAEFLLSNQKLSSWLYFTAILATVLFVLNVAWIDNSTGFGKPFIDAVSELSDSPEVNHLTVLI